jgi:hypothetical protein
MEECWLYVIFFACVCVWARQVRQMSLTIPLVMCAVFRATPQISFGRFFLFLADFSIFSGFLN